jgi:thiol-disulfide isomerase/thioredoxin
MRKNQRLFLNIAFAIMVAAVIIASLSGCAANDPLANQFKAGDNKNYIAGDGTVTEFSVENRKAAVEWSGTTESGEVISSSQLEGVVTVVNFWYAACLPCRLEAPDLVALAAEYPEAQFIGVNVRDSAETSAAFSKSKKLTWPSIIDKNDGAVMLAFTGIVTPNAVPTTLVVGKDGKVTSRVYGQIDRSILGTLIKTALEE